MNGAVFVNGSFVSEDQATISVLDRGFLYGDGLFETIRLYQGRPFRWDDHVARLRSSAEFLAIRIPFSPEQLRSSVEELVQRNSMPESILRIVLSRGAGPRGYSPKGADRSTLVMSLHATPPTDPAGPRQWRISTASLRVMPDDPLARHKTCNKLTHILARSQAEAQGTDEALLLNTRGEVAEATSGNLFWIDDQTVCTPPLDHGALPGVTRSVVFEICRELTLKCLERRTQLEDLCKANGVFLTSSGFEVVEAICLDSRDLARSPITADLLRSYRKLVSDP